MMASPGSSADIDTEERGLSSASSDSSQPDAAGCDLVQDDSATELLIKAQPARALLLLLKKSDDIMNLLLADKQDSRHDQSLADQLFKNLKEIYGQLTSLQPDVLHLIGEAVYLESVESIALMYKFHDAYFLKLGTGLDQYLVYSLLYVLIVLGELAGGNERVRKYLVNSGSLYQNFFELEELKKTLSDDELAHKFVICNLMILYNCAMEYGFHRYFLRLDPLYFWTPFCSSSSFSIKIHSTFIAGHLATYVPSMSLEIIKLDDADIKILCEMLGQASTSDNFEVRRFECIFSAKELVSGIRSILHHDLNRKRLLCNGILASFMAILVGGSAIEKKEVCLAIWDLTAEETFVKTLDSMELPLVDILTELESNVDAEFKLLLSGLIYSLSSHGTKVCPEACYKYKHYDQCMEQCNNVIENMKDYNDITIELAYLLRAKCLYHIYRKEQLCLASSKMERKDLQKHHGECYKKARDAIISLGKSKLDPEGSYMLDISMMEYATETNCLDDIRRCLLCQRKEKLVRSHFCPHSILKEFCAAMKHPENLQVFDTKSESLDSEFERIGHLKSPKQLTTYAFCKTCEDILSTYGEQDFLPLFFRKIYSINGPCDNGSEEHIEYGPWLYHFCVGILFRALIKHKVDSFFNSDELYRFFVMCRRILLNPSLQEESNSDLPHIFILIGPHESDDQNQQYGFMNQALTEVYFTTTQSSSLLDGTTKPPYPAHYLLVHIGVMNIITIFSPSSSCILPSEWQVNPVHGVFRVPTEKERGDSFTPGLWTFYQLYALERSRLWLERPLAPLQRNQKRKMIKPPAYLESVFHIQSSATSDLTIFEKSIIPSPDPKRPRVIALLPHGFFLHPTFNPNTVQLPDNHRILFHLPKRDKEVYFLAIGQGGIFNFSAPYVIYSHIEPGLQFSCGFFIDPVHLTFKEFLPLREGRVLLERIAVLDELKANIQDILKKMLRCKGVICLTDILQMCQFNDSFKLQNFDLRCFGQEYCWYCVNRCSFCLKFAGSDYSILEEFGKVSKFCSQECSKRFKDIIPFKSVFHQVSLAQEDKEFVVIEVSGTGKAPNSEFVYQINLKVFIGAAVSSISVSDPAPNLNEFAFFHCRSLHLQTVFQLCVGECDSQIKFSPLHAVPLPQNMQEAFNDMTALLNKSLSYLSLKDLSLKHLYNFLRSTVCKAWPIDTAVVNLPFPILKVTLMLADDMLKEVFEIVDLQCALNHPDEDKKDQKSDTALSEKASDIFSLEITEDRLSLLLKVLPVNSVVCTEYSTSVGSINLTEKHQAQLFYLPVKLLVKFCSMHFQGANNVLKSPLKESNVLNENAYTSLHECFTKAIMCMKGIPASGLHKVGDDVGNTMKALTNTLCQLLELLYCGLNSKLSGAASQCFLASMTAVASLSTCSSILRDVLLSSTNIVRLLLSQLQELRQVQPLDQFMKELIVAILQLCGSLTKETKHHWQFMEANFPDVVMPYLRSSLTNIAFAAKLALAPLFLKLEEDQISLIGEHAELYICGLNFLPGITVNDNLPLPQVSVLQFIKLLLSHEKSSSSTISALPDILDRVSSILQQDEEFLLEKKGAIDLLWKLTYMGYSLSITSHPDLIAQLLSFTGEEGKCLQRMTSCVLWKLELGQQDMPEFYIEECYLNGYYAECISECEFFLKTFESSKLRTDVMLIQGKALFKVYSAEQENLRKQHLPDEKLYRSRHSACYSKTKTAILLLGSLLDKNLLDDEGSQILDLCMIDYIYESNHSCQRCLLCRQKGKLKKSHIWPRALLEDFSSGVEMPSSRRALLVSWQSQNKYWSPKEVTLYMFCESCEGLLSRHGETQFVPKFFRQIYDVSIPGKPQSESSIEYGEWLYEFCIGIIFRGIAQRNMLKFVNSEEIYKVLTLCRVLLLECTKNASNSALKQDVFVMLSPTEARGEDTKSGFINRVLNMPAFYGVEEIQLSDGLLAVPRAAQYFVAHFGLINILIKFKCSTYTLPIECKIDPNGGKLSVPGNEYRKCLLPAGVWSLFLRLAQDFEVHWLTRSTEAVEQYSKTEKKKPEKVFEETFGFVSATQKDFEALQVQVGLPAPNNDNKIVSFLPKQFKLHRSDQQSYVHLPKCHHILLHYNYIIPFEEGAQETVFLCVGNDKSYTYDKPYVIYHYFRPDGFQLSAGFFISPSDLSAQEFLPETEDKFEVSNIAPIATFRMYIPKLLTAIAIQKGFCTFNSLFLRLQSGGNVSAIDMKCPSPSRCWYCINRCELCMKETEIGCLWIIVGPIPVCYCSNCQHLHSDKSGELVTKVSTVKTGDPIPLAVSPLSSSHKVLLYIECESTTSKGAPVLMRMTLCFGKHSDDLPIEAPYVVYHFWTLFQQQFLEFTVSPDMVPNEPVAYTAEAIVSRKAVIDLRDGPICKILSQGIHAAGYKDVHALISNELDK